MRRLLILAAAALAAAPATAADLPAVVLHVKPVGPLFDDIRAGAKAIGGPDLVKQFDDAMKKALGEKGIAGLDPTRPIVGYAQLADKTLKADETPFVIAVPITTEAAFLDLITRANNGKGKAEPVPGKAGLFKLPHSNPLGNARDAEAAGEKPTVFRFHQTYAYVTQETNAAALDPAALVPAEKLAMPGETAVVAMKLYFDRFPEEVRTKFAAELEKGLEGLKDAPLPPDVKNRVLTETAQKLGRQMLTRYVNQAKEATEATVRMVFDAKTGEVGVEFALGAKPGTSLAKDIAARKSNTNRFAGLAGKDVAAGAFVTAPLFAEELREIFGLAIESGVKEGTDGVPPFAQPLVAELGAGVNRTLKAGNLDAAVVLTGPDKAGQFTAVGAISFDDTAKLEKELRTLLKEQAPPDIRNLVTLDAAKAGGASIHLVKLPPGQVPPEAQKLFGESAAVGIAFAPKGIYLAFGPDPVAALKAAVVKQPGEARVIDVMINPAKVGKLAAAVDSNGESAKKVAEMIGDKDELYSILFFTLEGGTELRARMGVNVKLVSGFALRSTTIPGAPPR